MTRLLVATTNHNKVREIRQLLADAPVELLTLDAWPELAAPKETGRTFEENARLKAEYYAEATGELTVAEDSGLEIAALGGAPGVESARFGGADASVSGQVRAHLHGSAIERRAREPGAIRLCARRARPTIASCSKDVGPSKAASRPLRGASGGFGYDPIFFYPPFGQTLAEVGDLKAAVSHRGKAFRKLCEFLQVFTSEQAESHTRDGR